MNKMTNSKTKNLALGLAAIYAAVGFSINCYKTGHYSSDLYTGMSKITSYEKKVYSPIFEKLGIESKILENLK